MKLRNGKVFPRDYLLQITDETGQRKKYQFKDDPSQTGTMIYDRDRGRWRTETLEHDPAYRAIVDGISDYDLLLPADRIEFILLVTSALVIDPHGYVAEIAMRAVDNLEKANKMDELEEFNARLAGCEQSIQSLVKASEDPDMAVLDAREAGTRAYFLPLLQTAIIEAETKNLG